MEDFPDTREVLAEVLTHLGHWVETASEAGDALDRLRQGGIDLLLTDVWLPRANGWSMLQLLRKRGNLPPYVVSMSAMHVDDALGPSKAAGCFAHLVQPFRLKELEDVLERICAPRI